jgi:hypothetical protein
MMPVWWGAGFVLVDMLGAAALNMAHAVISQHKFSGGNAGGCHSAVVLSVLSITKRVMLTRSHGPLCVRPQDFAAAARLGDPYAMFNLGYMHLKGIQVPQNTSQAVNYFQQAAARGLAAGHNGLGVLAFHGQGMARDLAAAKEHFEAGAAQGSADSMYNLGGMHMEGERLWMVRVSLNTLYQPG